MIATANTQIDLSVLLSEPEDLYHRRSAEFLSSHRLGDFRRSPLLFHRRMAGLIPDEETSAFLLGRGAHVRAIEGIAEFQKRFAIGGPINPKTGRPFGAATNAFAEWAAAQGKPVLTLEQAELIEKMTAGISANDRAIELLSEGVAERVARVELCGMPCQARFDWVNPVRGIVDLKTCDDLTWFEADARRYEYAHQMAFYRSVLRAVTGQVVPVHFIAIKKHALENPLLLADFAEAIHPLRCLENSSKRQLQQHCRGQLTHVHWGQDKLVFPTIEGDNLPAALREAGLETSPSCGSIITTTSLDSHLRGQQHSRVDGSIIRPSLVLLDDPQTRESARSLDQTRKRMELLHGDVMGMAGPGETISALCTCTVTYENDLADTLLDRDKSPDWDSERTKLVISWPTEEKMWDRYAEIRRTDGPKAATAFYAANRARMDAGAVVAWPARVDTKAGELSAIQNAMNLKLRMRDQFAAECQNEPTLPQVSDQVLTIDQVIEKANAYRRGDVPVPATKMTMFVDLHDKLLYYMVCAWEETFSGYIIDYGTFPDQRRSIFTLTDATRTLGRAFPGAGVDGAIHAGLEQLVSTYLAKEWSRAGSLMKIDRLLVDMGYKPGIAADVQRRVGGNAMMLSKGVAIRASRKPIAEYARKPGETIGHYWYIPSVRRTGQFPHVMVDVNYWKRFVHDSLVTSIGDRGCISIFGKDGRAHELLAEHIARSEKWVEVKGPAGLVREWSQLPTRPDNHWFDCLVGCAAAASMCGIKAAGEIVPVRARKRYSRDDLRRT